MIFETIISTVDVDGSPHITPFGIRKNKDIIIISPYKPSTTLNNILTTKTAVVNYTDDVRVFAAAIARKQAHELLPATQVNGVRLAHTLSHQELTLEQVIEDDLRPQLHMRIVAEQVHQPFAGFNRAQAAVIELAVLVSRLHMLPKEKVMTELSYLQIAIDKTAGERELQAWFWLTEKITNFYAEQTGDNQA